MCGLLTWITKDIRPWSAAEQELQRESLGLISHRGPDDSSESIEDGLWMGFHRLSILDVSLSGRQPMSFGAGRYNLVFNGEIYNFNGLRSPLGELEHDSSGDSVILGSLLVRQPLEEVLGQLRGMFAFGWWDRETREFIAARDPFGIKPLYYCQSENGDLIVGSELRATRRLAEAGSEVSGEALAQFLRWGAVQSPNSLIADVKCLPPGHYLKWKDGELKIERYFVPSWPREQEWIKDPAKQREVTRETFLSSLKAHLVSDVPIGVFLSGGLDSTMIAAGMKHLGYEDIQAFSIGYEDESGVPDETDAAGKTAKHLGCEFIRERISSDSLFESLDDYFASLDQPSGDAMNTWLVSRLAAKDVKVALSGLGADEWFGGYNYMRLVALTERVAGAVGPLQKLTGSLVSKIQGSVSHQTRSKQMWKAFQYASGAAGMEPKEWYTTARSIFSESEIAKVLDVSESQAKDWTLGTRELSELFEALESRAPDSTLNELLLVETEGYLANTLLRDNDATSMARSIELRVPFVDSEIFKLVGQLPPDSKMGVRRGKTILRESMADLLPPWVSSQSYEKQTFTLPLMKWMRNPKWQDRIKDVLGAQACRERGWVDSKEVELALKEYETFGSDGKAGWKLSQRVWMLFVLESWAQQNLGN